MRLTIAIDGPAGAGKSTIAKLIGSKYKIMYINTGAMYRGVTYIATQNNIPPENIEELCNLIDSLDMHFEGDNLIINGTDVTEKLTMPEISGKVSNYAAIPEVRKKLVKMQQSISEKYDVIMDGRDIGTVVLKDAKIKFFLTATAEERADRRFKELTSKGINVVYNDILKSIKDRDYIDSNRKADPLRKADDAIEIDSSNMSINEVVDAMCNHIDKVLLNN